MGSYSKLRNGLKSSVSVIRQNIYPREVTVTGQKQLPKPEVRWPVIVSLDTYFLAMALNSHKESKKDASAETLPQHDFSNRF
jgi:hypothetical protein